MTYNEKFSILRSSKSEFLSIQYQSELKGWTTDIRDKKISQLASIIRLMFGGGGPALLGVCEVENEAVIKRLANAINIPGRNYTAVIHDSDDARGIDTSFIIDYNGMTVISTDHQVVIKRTATRDLFWVRLRVNATGAEFVAVANHWPSRSAGQYASGPFRMLVGETHAFIVSRLLDENLGGEKNLPIISMGDYNDEPYNHSMQEYTLGARDPGRVRYSRSGYMLNLMWPLMKGHDPGTYLFGSNWNMLDQFLVSYGMLRTASQVQVRTGSVNIFKPDILKARSGKPRKFSRPSAKGRADLNGYSDHFPITVELNV